MYKVVILNNRRIGIWLSFGIAIITVAVFCTVIGFDFLNLDDDLHISSNPHVNAGLTVEGVKWAFTKSAAIFWHPVTWLSHMLDCQLFGLKPGAHHLVNVMFHCANALLLFGLLIRITSAVWPSAWVAILFAVHPLHVESVAWVSERKDTLSVFFFMLCLWAYARYVERPRPSLYWLAVFIFALGLMAKSMLVTMPFVLLLLDIWPFARLRIGAPSAKEAPGRTPNRLHPCVPVSRVLCEKVPFLALSIMMAVITIRHAGDVHALKTIEVFPVGTRIINALISYLSYLRKTFWPNDLAVYYPAQLSWPRWQVALAISMMVGASIWAVKRARVQPYLFVGWFWYLGTLVPVIGLVQAGDHAMADRYTYIPLIGVFVMLAWWFSELVSGLRHGKYLTAITFGLTVSACTLLASVQVRYWRNSFTLFNHALDVTKNNYLAHFHLGQAFAAQGNTNEALQHYTEAIRILPTWSEGHNNLGTILYHQGKQDEAIHHFQEALRSKPSNIDAHMNLAGALANRGSIDEAVSHYSEALRQNADFPEAHVSMGNALLRLGRIDDAVTHFSEALRLKPNLAGAHLGLGLTESTQRRFKEAIAHYTAALRLDPNLKEAHQSLAIALEATGQPRDALAHYNEAARLEPENFDIQNNLAISLFKQGKYEESAAHFSRALRAQPSNTTAHVNLANALAMNGKTEQAISNYVDALRIDTNHVDAHNYLGVALFKLGRISEASLHFKETIHLNSNHIGAHKDLGRILLEQGNYAEALDQFSTAIRLSPEDAYAHYQAGLALTAQVKTELALSRFREAIRLRPEFPDALNAISWIMATHEDARFRDGMEAVRLVSRAIQLTRPPSAQLYNTLAAAQAEVGRFDEAIASTRKAIGLATASNQKQLAEQINVRLQLYQAGKPFRDANLSSHSKD